MDQFAIPMRSAQRATDRYCKQRGKYLKRSKVLKVFGKLLEVVELWPMLVKPCLFRTEVAAAASIARPKPV